MAERRVVITGVGAVSPLGIGYDAFRQGLLAGRNGATPISQFDASCIDVRVAAEVPGYSDDLLPSDPRHHVVLNRAMRLGLVAAAECIRAAGLDDAPDVRARMACSMTVSRMDVGIEDFGESFARSMKAAPDEPSGFAFDRAAYVSRGHRATHPLWMLKFIPNLAVAHVVRTFGTQGEANTYTSEAAASIQLLGHAAESIREGLYDIALCGASDARITPMGVARYLPLGLLATGGSDEVDVSRPFDAARRGYVLGEGAVFFVVEALEHAARRGATPLAEILGWGEASDAHHPYRAHPEGRGLGDAMMNALQQAAISAEEVDAVVATAASLPDLDSAEAAALGATFGSRAPAVTAPAGAIGRTHSAVGAFGTAAALVALESQAIPPTANTATPAPDAPPGLVVGREPRHARVRNVLVNAYSFGGQCASLLLAEVAR